MIAFGNWILPFEEQEDKDEIYCIVFSGNYKCRN